MIECTSGTHVQVTRKRGGGGNGRGREGRGKGEEGGRGRGRGEGRLSCRNTLLQSGYKVNLGASPEWTQNWTQNQT